MTNKTFRLFIDDERFPENVYGYTKLAIYLKEWLIVRNYKEFVAAIEYNGLPDIISFDHDLGHDHIECEDPDILNSDISKTGYDCAKWLVNYCIDTKQLLPNYLIHSRNPVGAENIENLMINYSKFLENKQIL